ncbi:MAG: 3-isopropylmalate dehydratase large subunit [Planctomycetes bacterium]|nr:3-isopropylmalate dehydratase large subunit [Planctomycetota bacterium]
MGHTLIEKIIANHCDQDVKPGATVDMRVDVRAARDFGGANVVKNLKAAGLGVDDPAKTIFTFDCNPGGSDQGYAANQQYCREFARETGVVLRDVTQGIGTHVAIEDGWVGPGTTFVSTDSHANIMGAVGAFGQGMGDQDIAYAWSAGKVWFKVPKSAKIILKGKPGPHATAKDIVLKMLQKLGAGGLLGYAAEIGGDMVAGLSLEDRVTIASMSTEMGGIISLFEPNQEVLEFCRSAGGRDFQMICADADANYDKVVEVDVAGLGPMVARPGHPDDTVALSEVAGRKVDSVFVGSCTNGRLEDLRAAAQILEGRKVAPGVVMKVVPSTRKVWQAALDEGLVKVFMDSGALVGNAGCGGCAAGQLGQNGPGEVTVSTGNRNFAGKQGKGEVYLASPETAAATALAGVICSADAIPDVPVTFEISRVSNTATEVHKASQAAAEKPTLMKGRAWIVYVDNIDTDMIFHNRYLAITDMDQMGQYTFDNLQGWEDFATKAKPGDIVITGSNFGCGSSRQQAVDCFTSLGVQAIVATSYGSIYERNAINAGMPMLVADAVKTGLKSGDEVEVDLAGGTVRWQGGEVQGNPFSEVQMQIYQRGGLLV